MLRNKWNYLKFGVVIAIFVYLYLTGQLELVYLKRVLEKPGLFGISALFIILSVFVAVQRWRVLLRVQGVDLGMVLAVKLSMIGYFFSTAIPGAVSGDVVKAYYLAKGEKEKERLFMSVILDRLLGMYSMFLVAATAVLIIVVQERILGQQGVWTQSSVKVLSIFILAVFLGFTLLWCLFITGIHRRLSAMSYLLKRAPFHDTITNIVRAMEEYGQRPGLTMYALLLSLLCQFFLYMGMWVLALLLEIRELTFINYLFALPVALVINAIPLAPGGLGVGEAGFRGIFLLFRSNKGAELAVLFHVIFFFFALGLGGIVYLLSDFSKKKYLTG